MAKKVLLQDWNKNEILPITRGELILDSSGEEAFHSKEFLATTSLPGLMSNEDKTKLDSLVIDASLSTTSTNPVQNKVITTEINNIKSSYLKSATVSNNTLTIVDQSNNSLNFYNTTYNIFSKETSEGKGGNLGLVPIPNYNLGSSNRYLREDGTWVKPDSTTYTFKEGTNGFTVTPSGGDEEFIKVIPNITNNVIYSGTLVDKQVAIFDETSGKIKASGYTIASNVPSGAKFTDTTYSNGEGLSLSDYIFSLKKSSTDTLGGIKIAKDNAYTVATHTSNLSLDITAVNQYYGVELDSTGKAFVYVPWLKTEYSLMDLVEANTGTATTARTISAKVLHDKIKSLLPSVMIGATSSSNGLSGLVPQPVKGNLDKYLKGDGSWGTPLNNKVTLTNTTNDVEYRVLFSENANDTTSTEGARKSINLKFNPYTGTLTAIKFNGNLDWSKITNKPTSFTPSAHEHPTNQINALTGYSKAEEADDLATTDTLNTALGKLEYKADAAYNWYKNIFGPDTDDIINKYDEIVDFVDSVKEGSDITDEFVTRKTELTVTGAKTFSLVITSTVADGTAPFAITSTTKVTNLNVDMLDGYHESSFVKFTDRIYSSDTTSVRHMGYGYSANGWKGSGPAISIGAANGYIMQIQQLGEIVYVRHGDPNSFTDWKRLAYTATTDTANVAAANKVANKLTLKINSGTSEGTNLYTYDGSNAKTLDIKAGSNITLTTTEGVLTISAPNSNTTYTLSGALNGNTFDTFLTPSSGDPTKATVPAMVGATASAAGKAGLVPAPGACKNTSFLRGDGTWAIPLDTKVTSANNHYDPSTDTNYTLDKDASSTTDATLGTTSLVTGVTLSRDSKGHVTGLSIDSIKLPSISNTWRPITNEYDADTTSNTTSLSQTGAKSLQRNVRSFKRFQGSATVGGYDLNTLTEGMVYNYSSTNYWKNGPSGMSYGRVLNLKDGSGGSIAGLLAWDTNHGSTTDTTRYLWWRVSDDGTFTEAKWHRLAYVDDIPSIPSVSITNTGSGNAVTSITASGHTLTVTKGSTFSLSEHTHEYLPLAGGTMNTASSAIAWPTGSTNATSVPVGITVWSAYGTNNCGAPSLYEVILNVKSNYTMQIACAATNSGAGTLRFRNSTGRDWIKILDENNYTLYTPILNSSSIHADKSSVIYAPTTSGSGGDLLISDGDGNAPVWTNPGNITVGSAGKADKLGTATKGSTTKPIYLNAGAPTECSTYAGGTAVTLNGASKSASTASFYAPTTLGTNGQVLKSNGSAVYWASDNNTDTKVTLTLTTNDTSYPLLLAPAGQTTTTTTTAYFDSGVTLNPSTNTLSGIGNMSISGSLGKGSKYLIKPNAEYTGTTSKTGAITITLPASINNTMVSMWVDIYNYVTNTSFSVHVGGYTYNYKNTSGNTIYTWANNPFAMVYGAEHKVRLGHNGTNFIIYIGELDSSWTHPQIAVRDVLLGFTPSYENWAKLWTISFTQTEFANVTANISHYAYTTKNLSKINIVPQQRIRGIIFDTTPMLLNDISFDGLEIETSPFDTTNTPNAAPLSKSYYTNKYVEAYSDPIHFFPGETIVIESWIMRPKNATGTAGTYYLGIEFKDLDGKVVGTNNGCVYFSSTNGYTCPKDGVWYKRINTYTIPVTHNAYTSTGGTSNGGGYYTGTLRVLLNHDKGTIPTYWGGCVIYTIPAYIGTTALTASSTPGQSIAGIGNIIPETNESYTLGVSNKQWYLIFSNKFTSGNTTLYYNSNNGYLDYASTNGYFYITANNIAAGTSGGFVMKTTKNGVISLIVLESASVGLVKLTGNTTVTGTMTISGDLKANNGVFYTNSTGAYHTSDVRKKTNITKARNLDIADLLVEFDWKESGKHSWGYIAQDLLEVLPEAVDYNEDTYSVNYNVAHSAAIASLTARIKELEEKLKRYGLE